MDGERRNGLNRRILAIAVPSLGALVAEPLFLLADSAIVGHLGTVQLAGLTLASTVLSTVVGLSIFLAYGTTAGVSRLAGAGDLRAAVQSGVDGMWLAITIGAVLMLLVVPLSAPLVEALGGSGAVAQQGAHYLVWAGVGLPGMLLVLAATGVLRGLHRAAPTLWVAAAGAVVNVGLNLLFVYGFGWGIAGSAIGTSVVQTAMGLSLAAIVVARARAMSVGLAPRWAAIRRAGRVGLPLFLRTLTLRAAIVATVAVAAAKGETTLAALQVTFGVWTLLALALDAVAIAAQALTGAALGAGDAVHARLLARRMTAWGIGSGVLLGVALLAVSPWVGRAFTDDPTVIAAVTSVLWVVAAGQLVSGWVFVLDGILLGAGDNRYLAVAGLVNLAAYLPALWLVWAFAPVGSSGLRWLWIGFIVVLMGTRAITLGVRYRGDRWLVLGS